MSALLFLALMVLLAVFYVLLLLASRWWGGGWWRGGPVRPPAPDRPGEARRLADEVLDRAARKASENRKTPTRLDD